MKSAEEWKTMLRSKLREALSTRQAYKVAVLRETLAAIENAEAPSAAGASIKIDSVFARSVSGLRAGEVARLVLPPEAICAIIEREIKERRDAADQYTKLGRDSEAGILTAQADLLSAIDD